MNTNVTDAAGRSIGPCKSYSQASTAEGLAQSFANGTRVAG
jgi:hypothetical protein